MIRAGARAPQPPYLPSTPTSPKPRHVRDTEQNKERLLHRIRLTENLREKVVQLAKRKEERIQRGEISAGTKQGESSSLHFHNAQFNVDVTDKSHDQQGVTVLLVDLKKGDASAKDTARYSNGEGGKTVSALRKRWEKISMGEINSSTFPPSPVHADGQPSVVSPDPQRPPPDSPQLPRSAAHRIQTLTGVRGPRLPQPREEERNPTEDNTKPTTTSITAIAKVNATNSSKPAIRTLRAPTRIVMNQCSSDLQDKSSPSPSPRSQELPRRPDSEETQGQQSPKENHSPKQETHREPSSPVPHPPTRPSQGFNYRRAARVLHTNPNPGPPAAEPQKRVRICLGQERRGPRPKSVKLRAEECSSHYQSSGSSGDSPRQTSGGVEQVGELRGNAVPSSANRLHTPLSPRRRDNKNPSSFASSLEMFKRRLKMNQSKFPREGVEKEEDYVIRLGDTIPAAGLSPSQKFGHNLEPHPPDFPPPPAIQQQRQQQRPAAKAKVKADDRWLQGRGADEGNGLVQKLREQEETLGERSEGDGEEGEEELKEIDCNASSKMSESAEEELPFVSLGEPARAPLPRVKTYVVEGDATKQLQDRCNGLPLSLTQHNVSLHNTFVQRRLEREKMRLRRAELERRAGLASAAAAGGGEGVRVGWTASAGNPDAESRMRRWLIETEYQQSDWQPLVSFKVAVATA